jgi:diguanylate cyclase (GGDEF)-like protein/PAS domain S-box-containing protein
MRKVKSLTYTITLQFVIILVPITLVFLYQAFTDVQHANQVKFNLQRGLLAQQALNSYKVFLNGTADAVDTGFLSNKAGQALKQTDDTLLALQAWDPTSRVEPLLEPIGTLLNIALRNPSVEELLPLRTAANRVDKLLTVLVEDHKLRERQNIEDIAEDTKRQVWVTGITLAIAIGFIFLLIKRLTEPLYRAVTLAEAIAAGDFKAEKTIDTHGDIGGLLTSLAAMRGNLRRAFLDLANNEKRLSNAQHIANIGDWEIDIASGSLTRSDEVYPIVGRKRGELSDTNILPPEIVHPEDKQLVGESFSVAQRRREDFSIDFRIVLPNGDTRFVHAQSEVVNDDRGEPIKIAGIIQDINARKIAEQQIQYLALHDGLTGLVNRQYFEEELNKEFALAQRHDYMLAVLFLDLDRFKNINDSLGHHVGDALLKEAADRITKSMRHSDSVFRGSMALTDSTLARMGGDEFTLMLTHLSHVEDAARVAQRILEVLALPFNFEGHEVFISASIGIALFPHDGSDAGTILKNSDIAMYHAKSEGRNNYQFFQQSLKKEASFKLSLESDLRKALVQEQFVLYYQPQIEIATRKIFGVEALIRWQHPQRGLVPPVEFIPLAEESGMIIPISEWVLRTACRQGNAWHKAGLGTISISVNMPSPIFRRLNLIEEITNALKASGLDAKYLELEVTESIMMHQMETVLQTLKILKGIGINLSIDDFGTGYSSLSYLQRFPIDTLKIDRTFVNNLDKPQGAAIALAIIGMAEALNLRVIAEGVETENQEQFLLEHGCGFMQGYLFSRPLPADDMMRLLQQQKT